MQTYKPTLMQKLLRKNYKWWYLVKFCSRTARADLSVNIVVQFALIIQALLVLYVWKLGGFGVGVFTYLMLGRIYKALSDSYFFDILGKQINDGSITKDLMYPQNYLTLTFFRTIGYRVIDNFTSAIGMLTAAILASLFFANFQFDFTRLLLIFSLLPISFIIQHLTGFTFGCLAFFLKDPRSFYNFQRVYNTVFLVVFTGTILPLDKLPLGDFILWTPFAFFLHQPMQIYLGEYTAIETLYVFLGGISWCVALYLLAKIVFKSGLKRNEAVGL